MTDRTVLLEQVSWMRRLARELVTDRELAEDLVQETCVVALERAPREAGKLRAWLSEVMRNVLRQHARSSDRRHEREAAIAHAETHEPSDDLVARVQLQRELVSIVLELDEPYRSTVLLRYFDELPPREIARRAGVPVATVHSRLQRALARLRERLDSKHHAWCALFLPWVRGGELLGPPTVLGVLMKTQLTLVAAATALAAGALVWWSSSSPSGRAPSAAAPSPTALAAPRASAPPFDMGDTGDTGERANEREALPTANAAAPVAAAPSAEPAAAPWTVRLHVLDAEGASMSGIAVRAEGSDAILGTSDSAGWCVFDTRADRLLLSAADPRWVTISAGSPSRASTVDPVMVLAPSIDLAGSVHDEPGRALPGASVRFDLPDGFRTRFSQPLEATRTTGWLAAADAEGGFALERVPAVAGATLSAVAAGYRRATLEAPLFTMRGLELLLARPTMPLAGVLRGRVVDPAGAPVAEARVGLGLASVVSDERGEFELALARAVTSEVLTAVKAGFRPARMERPAEPDASSDSSGWPDHVTLVLPGPPLTIRGHVVDHDDKPVSGARVWVHDPTPGTPIGIMPTYLEALMAGAPIPPQALESEANLPEQDGDSFTDWYTNSVGPSALWFWVVTDEAGGFTLPGLDERRYRLDVLRPDSIEVVTSETFSAGESSIVIRLGRPDVFERVNGRVLSERGDALADIAVELWRPMIDARARVFGGNSQVVLLEVAGHATTDAEGRFHFEDVPKTGAKVSVRGDGIVPTSADVAAAALDVAVEMRCHLEVVLAEPTDRFDFIEVADADGERLDIMVLTEGSTNAWTGVSLVEGRSGVVSVSSRARQLRLFQDDVLIETRPLDLVPGEVNRIEL